MDTEKNLQLLELTRKRQADRFSPHCNLADFHNGYYECDYVSPWTKSANNVNAPLMLIGQDWSSSDRLRQAIDAEQRDLGHTPSLQANINLQRLLKTHMNLTFSETYATNLFPFIKIGPMNSTIPMRDMTRCARDYALPQIKIVSPVMVLCLGRATFNAIRRALSYSELRLVEASRPDGHTRYEGSEIYAVPHTGGLGTANAGGHENVDRTWQRIACRWHELLRSRSGS